MENYSKKAWAPYNFIPFGKFISRYKSEDQLPAHNMVNEEGYYSGEITYTFRNLTEIAVGSHSEDGFCKNGEGKYIVPGSTMRGFFRSHAELLSFSYPELMDDSTYMTRQFAGKGKAREKYYKLIATTDSGRDSSKNIYNTVDAGLVYWNSEKNCYCIRKLKPINKGKSYARIAESKLVDCYNTYLLDIPDTCFMYSDYIEARGKAEPKGGNRNFGYRPFYLDGDFAYDVKTGDIVPWDTSSTLSKVGLFNNSFINNKQHLFIISALEDDPAKDITIPDDMRRAYEKDLYRNKSLGRTDKEAGESNRKDIFNFYKLPEEGSDEKKVFFFIYKNNILYAFGASPFMRVQYPKSTKSNLTEPEGISYVSGMFGFIKDDSGRRGKTAKRNSSYKGRLSFSSAVCGTNDVKLNKNKLLLSSPSASAAAMYIEQGDTVSNFYDGNFTIRGQKVYLKRDKIKTSLAVKNEKTESVIYALPKEQIFKGKIYFNSLTKDELGLLLASIQLKKADDNSVQETFMLGKAKPYGYGRIEISNVKLNIFDNKTRFINMNLSAYTKSKTEKIEDYKEAFITKIDSILKDYNITDRYRETRTFKLYQAYAQNKVFESLNNKEVYMNVDEYGKNPLPVMEQLLGIPYGKNNSTVMYNPLSSNDLTVSFVFAHKDGQTLKSKVLQQFLKSYRKSLSGLPEECGISSEEFASHANRRKALLIMVHDINKLSSNDKKMIEEGKKYYGAVCVVSDDKKRPEIAEK